jgi:hypothetical protein
MVSIRSSKAPLILLSAVLCFGTQATGQSGSITSLARAEATARPWAPDAAILFLSQYGIENFPPHYIAALQTLVQAQKLYGDQDYAGAQSALDDLWAQHPPGDPSWAALPTQPFGINLGSPPCYYGLRMLTDMVTWRVDNPGQPPPPRTVRLTVVLVGQSSGIEPQDLADLHQGTGVPVVHTLDPRIPEDDFRVVRESLRLFRRYIVAATQGQLDVELKILSLPAVDLPVYTSGAPGAISVAALADATQVFPLVPEEDLAATDWWWLVYPSHVPEQHPDFEDTEFITGGMGAGPYSSPLFIIDDRWLVRKPPHLGQGEYTTLERKTYLPQWLQHEFFHHLFRTYPEFGLEATPHQWFDHATWPPDFVGLYEPDYFHEALIKRLQLATPPLHVALRYATAGAPWDQLTMADVLGSYRREPVLNPWHVGDIQFAGPQLQWLNTAPFSWDLQDDLLNGRLLTGPDCPYYGSTFGTRFDIVLARDALGDLTDEVEGFSFVGELYERQ